LDIELLVLYALFNLGFSTSSQKRNKKLKYELPSEVLTENAHKFKDEHSHDK